MQLRHLALALLSLALACGADGEPADADGEPADADADADEEVLVIPDDGGLDTMVDAGAPDAGGPEIDAGQPTGLRYFPKESWMYQKVDQTPLDPDSQTITSWLQNNGGFGNGRMQIDFSFHVLMSGSTTHHRNFMQTPDFFSPACDPAPFPIPLEGAVEGEAGYRCTQDGDCHLLVVDYLTNRLYEMWRANIDDENFYGGCAAIWDMSRVYGHEGRGPQCTSADAAGLPIAPLLFSADEVMAGSIDHAIRFILPNERMRADTYQAPATHAGAPSGPLEAPIYGSRWRLRKDFDLASLPSFGARVVATALQQYGMVLADGGNIALTAQSDRFTSNKWGDLLKAADLRSLQPSDFEIVQTGEPVPLTRECTRTPITK